MNNVLKNRVDKTTLWYFRGITFNFFTLYDFFCYFNVCLIYNCQFLTKLNIL